MKMIELLLRNFFAHKDFLPPPDQIPGTLFTPLHILWCTVVAVYIGFACVRCARQSEERQKNVFLILWLIMLATEPMIVAWDACAGSAVRIEWNSALSLWPCSIFLYTLPFAVWGKGKVRQAASGYICTLGLLGGLVNFVYPANYLTYYSCFSMAGFRTIFYHGAMVFTAVTMILSGYHSFKGVTRWEQLVLPAIPALLVSVPANIANAVIPGSDYMFFKMESFFFAPIGRATPDWFSLVLVYILYLLIHGLPYLPSYLENRRAKVNG